MGTASSAAMTLLNPIQGIMIGALCGLTQAAGVLAGKRLGLRRSPGPDRRIRPQMAGSLGLFPPLPGGMRPLRHFDARVSPEKVDAAPGGPGRSGRINRPARAANRNLPQPAHPPLALPRAGQCRSINKKGWAAQNVRPSLSDTGKTPGKFEISRKLAQFLLCIKPFQNDLGLTASQTHGSSTLSQIHGKFVMSAAETTLLFRSTRFSLGGAASHHFKILFLPDFHVRSLPYKSYINI